MATMVSAMLAVGLVGDAMAAPGLFGRPPGGQQGQGQPGQGAQGQPGGPGSGAGRGRFGQPPGRGPGREPGNGQGQPGNGQGQQGNGPGQPGRPPFGPPPELLNAVGFALGGAQGDGLHVFSLVLHPLPPMPDGDAPPEPRPQDQLPSLGGMALIAGKPYCLVGVAVQVEAAMDTPAEPQTPEQAGRPRPPRIKSVTAKLVAAPPPPPQDGEPGLPPAPPEAAPEPSGELTVNVGPLEGRVVASGTASVDGASYRVVATLQHGLDPRQGPPPPPRQPSGQE